MSSKQIISRRTPSLALLQALPSPLARLIEWIATSWSSGAASRSILPFIPKPVKWFFLIVLLFNARSWPGVWHARVFRSVFRIRLHALLYKRGDGRQWWTNVSPVGRSVFPTPNGLDKGARSVLKSWAAPDDCDWNGHLSNSCYAKNLDPARMQACIDWFPAFFGDGGWVALGGAHYHYIREIPINAAYEVRMSIGGWEDKWIYLVTKFVTLPKKKSKSTPHKAHGTTASAIPSITTPSTPSLIESSTPAEPATTTNSGQPLDASWVDTKLTPISAPKPTLRTHDDDGALIHCIAVSTYCFKHGRLTVPPKIALAMCGYSSGEVGDRSNWSHAARIRDRGTARVPEFYRGGWKNEENKFWEPSPKVEAERVRRVADLKKLTEGLDGLRAY